MGQKLKPRHIWEWKSKYKGKTRTIDKHWVNAGGKSRVRGKYSGKGQKASKGCNVNEGEKVTVTSKIRQRRGV